MCTSVRSRGWPIGCGVSDRPRVRPLTLKRPVGGSLRGQRVVLMQPSCSRPRTTETRRKGGVPSPGPEQREPLPQLRQVPVSREPHHLSPPCAPVSSITSGAIGVPLGGDALAFIRATRRRGCWHAPLDTSRPPQGRSVIGRSPLSVEWVAGPYAPEDRSCSAMLEMTV